ncbi:MAG: cysteine peptidase family C39 domain-containing protein [Candidatus Pacebacteria bacterium]|nr:cysteine peptidase family C39 domain-containing protein [Candidatus Paceibacterota bacterium]
MIKLKPFIQSKGFCGPASLKIVMDYYGVHVSESRIAKIARASREEGSTAKGLIAAANYFGFNTFLKDSSTLADIKSFIKKKIPVIVDWFYEDGGHYSVVADIKRDEVLLFDPALTSCKRKMSKEIFMRVWFDFPNSYIKVPKELILRRMLVLTPKNAK